ncbi:MAG: toll/interleukin-1 receptor domain-containing protein [Lachnospiraceae bacterium]|nr:toll/interleukin-1 receptor domain-containing protein [Lachnospiraceae bacterium]
MRIFISHATKNREPVLKFAELLEEVSSEIEVFCSSEDGSISIGNDFVKVIFKELSKSDLFIPIISAEYYESKFCMIELGVACSYLFNQYNQEGVDYIFPFVLYPVQKGQALSGTPIANIQAGDIRSEKDIHIFLKYLSSQKGIHIGAGVNRNIHSFIFEIDQIILKYQSIMERAKINGYFDDSIDFIHKEDIISIGKDRETIIINYNMNPYEKNVKRPNFISVVLQYVDKIDIGRYLDINNSAEFKFVITSFTNSLNRSFVEFKYSDNNRILETFEFSVTYGKNTIKIPLDKIKSKALNNISEICFVIHPDDVVEDEGMFKISDIVIC